MNEGEERLLETSAGDLDVVDLVPGGEEGTEGDVGVDAAEQDAVPVDLDGRHAGERVQVRRRSAGEGEADDTAPRRRLDLGGGAVGDDPAPVDHDDAAGVVVGL